MTFLAIADPPLLRSGHPLVQAEDADAARAEDADAARAVIADWRGADVTREVTLVPQMEEEKHGS